MANNGEDETCIHCCFRDGSGWPRERRCNKTSFGLCLFTGSVIIAYGAIYKTEPILKKYNTTTSANKKISLYTREEKETYPAFLNLGFGLLGIILGVFIDRICQMIEEICQCQLSGRYKNCTELGKKSFSGISWKTVGVVTAMLAASCILGRKAELKIADAIYVLGGIGVGPLLIHLLNLNTQSEIAVSTILEKKKMSPGYILAWSYYFTTFQKEIDFFFSEILSNSDIELELYKLILLLTPGTDIKNIQELIEHDSQIEPMDCGQIYKLKLGNGSVKRLAMACVVDPIVTLRELKSREKVLTDEKSYIDEMKRFYKTLTEILENAPHDRCTGKGLVVPVTVQPGHYEDLNNGGLVKMITRKVAKILKTNSGPREDGHGGDGHGRDGHGGDGHGGDGHGGDGHGGDGHGGDGHGEDEHGEDEHSGDEHGGDENGRDEHGGDEHGGDEHGGDEHGSLENSSASQSLLNQDEDGSTCRVIIKPTT